MSRFDRNNLETSLITAGYDTDQARARAAVLSGAAKVLENLTFDPDDAIALLVPGRIEFLGKHTDYCGGRSLLCAVERGFGIVAVPREDRIVRVTDALGAGSAAFPLDPDLAVAAGHWSNYAMTVARRLARNFTENLRGADIAFSSDLPPSAGMSSSSALMIAIHFVLAKINQLDERHVYRENIQSIEDLAGYLGAVENGQSFRGLGGDRGVGTFGGSQDHTAILCSRPGVLRQYSFCPVRAERDVPIPAGHVLAIASSGVIAEKTGGARDAYNAVSLSVSAIMQRWREQTGRADPTLADAIGSAPDAAGQLRRMLGSAELDHASSSRMIDRLEQFIAESTQIIPAVAEALECGRIDELGVLIDRSQELSEKMLRNQVPETIYLAKAARECGAAAASAFGAGFGGSVWAMIERAGAERFLAAWRERYARQFPKPARGATFFITSAGRAAHEVA